jgi:hypothetical protein
MGNIGRRIVACASRPELSDSPGRKWGVSGPPRETNVDVRGGSVRDSDIPGLGTQWDIVLATFIVYAHRAVEFTCSSREIGPRYIFREVTRAIDDHVCSMGLERLLQSQCVIRVNLWLERLYLHVQQEKGINLNCQCYDLLERLFQSHNRE